MTQPVKVGVSLTGLAGLALLAWRTMQPGRMQSFTWIVLAFFAFRIALTAARTRYDEKGVGADKRDTAAEDRLM